MGTTRLMRIVLGSNIFLNALLSPHEPSPRLGSSRLPPATVYMRGRNDGKTDGSPMIKTLIAALCLAASLGSLAGCEAPHPEDLQRAQLKRDYPEIVRRVDQEMSDQHTRAFLDSLHSSTTVTPSTTERPSILRPYAASTAVPHRRGEC